MRLASPAWAGRVEVRGELIAAFKTWNAARREAKGRSGELEAKALVDSLYRRGEGPGITHKGFLCLKLKLAGV